MSEIRAQLDKLVKALTGEGYAAELKAARQVYYAATGEIFEDDASFERRMITFVEWFVFDRPLARGVVPIRAYLEDHAADLSPEEREMTEALLHHHHGLYRVKKAKPPVLNLKDLWDGKLIRVEAGDSANSFQADDLLDARLVSWKDKTWLTDGILCHPIGALAYIQAELKALRKGGAPAPTEALFFRLAGMLIKHDRYRQIKTELIYRNTP
jgi:hypothetical protein